MKNGFKIFKLKMYKIIITVTCNTLISFFVVSWYYSKDNKPIVICHGLFGSKQNWSSISKSLSRSLSCDVYTVDLRNHGDSPHSQVHTYQAMSEDLTHFIQDQGLTSTVLIGHSMGGKVVMTTALQTPSLVSKLVVVDMPPVAMKLSHGFANYIKAMKSIEESNPKSQSEADKIIAQYEPNAGIRMFLLTNLKRQADGQLRFRIPYEILGRSLEQMGGFPVPEKAVYDKPTLFIAGGRSPYLKPFEHQADEIRQLFPNMELETVEDAGHWVHSEKPSLVMKSIGAFYSKDG
ncbi:Alpha/Beta hydrolase protein [Pilobolus umbonatus]|nr:Alpha/Beta hydrolase protein [Pilobolus umbonatus]